MFQGRFRELLWVFSGFHGIFGTFQEDSRGSTGVSRYFKEV